MEEQAIINTFNKGISQDVDFILQPDGTYRNMKNGMLISMDGHHFTIEISKGNKAISTLTPRYTEDETLFDIAPMPMGFVSFIDKLVVFSTNDTGTGGYGEIGVMTFKKIQDDFISTYTPYYHHPDLNFSKYHKIEGFSFRENDTTERVYFTDNNNEPRVFDIANPIFTTYIGLGDIDITSVIPKQYMVLSGVIDYAGTQYGPTDGSGTIVGNIFTSDGASNTYSLVTASASVIEYYPLSLLDWTPTRSMGDMRFKEYGSGTKNCGSSIYFYRLYSNDGKVYTTWSYPSSPIHVGMDNISTALTGNDYRDFVGNGSDTTIEASPYSVIISISDIDTDFDVIELCCAEYNQINDVPYIIRIVAQTNITSSVMDVTDNGSSNFGEVSINDLTLFPASILKVKTLSTDKNYNLIGNITEREEFNLDLTGVTLTQIEYPLVSHGDIGSDPSSCANGNVYADVSPTVGANPGTGDVLPYSRWLVTLGNDTTDTVEYPDGSGTFYVTGDVITGIEYSAATGDESTIAFTGSGAARPCTTRNRYTSIATGKRVENAIEFTKQESSFWDYKNPAVASHNKGYWSDERYRFGILFFDKKGNPYYVKYIDDFDFDKVYDKGSLLVESDATSSLTSYALNPSAIKLSGLDIPESIMNEVSGFSIVRAERDKRILAQGLLMQTVIDPTPPNESNRIMPLPINVTSWSRWQPFINNQGILCCCICPDWLVGYVQNNTQSGIGYIGEKLEEAFWIYGGIKADGDYRVQTSKMFFTSPPDVDTSYQSMTLLNMNGYGSRGFNENDAALSIIGDGRPFYNTFSDLDPTAMQLGGNYVCSGSPAWVGGGSYIRTVGCKKLLVLTTNFRMYAEPFGTNYDSWSARDNTRKIVVNYLSNKDKASQYGGQGDSAIAETLYISTGHFQPINDAVKADTLNGFFPNLENKYTFNDIEVFGGDCFTNLIDIGWGLWNNAFYPDNESMSYSMFVPMECSVNYNLRRGIKASNKGMYPNGSIAWDNGLATILEQYSYNKGYSTDGTVVKYPALPFNFAFSGRFEYRTRFAGVKYPGESIDSFRKFLLNDYKDLDGQLGEINNIRSKDGRVLIWQNHGVSSVPILERQLLAATSGAATTIGTGGVIDRFDPINSYYGNQHQHGLTSTEYGYIWFDMRNRALCIMGSTTNVQEISLASGLQAYFNNQFNEGDDTQLTASNIYNTNNYSMPEIPLLGYGIVGVYDPRYKMSYLTFKYADDRLIDLEEEIISITAKDFTIGYSHVLDAIIGFYDFTPGIWHNHNDLVLSSNNSKNYVYYGFGMPETTFNIGDVVKVDNDALESSLWGEYICVIQVTIESYGLDTDLEPGYPRTIYWLKINAENEIYLQTFNTDYCKFYGKVYDHEVEVIVNPKSDQAFSILRIQQKSNDTNYTSVYFSTDNQAAQDTNIPSNSKTYRYIDKSYYSSAPLPRSGGRLTDHYVKIKFVLKNYLSNPTVANNKNKIFQFLKTWFISRD